MGSFSIYSQSQHYGDASYIGTNSNVSGSFVVDGIFVVKEASAVTESTAAQKLGLPAMGDSAAYPSPYQHYEDSHQSAKGDVRPHGEQLPTESFELSPQRPTSDSHSSASSYAPYPTYPSGASYAVGSAGLNAPESRGA